MSDIKEKVDLFNKGYIQYQFKIFDAAIAFQNQLNPKDDKEGSIYVIITGGLLSLMSRVRGIINTIKELTGEVIDIPERFHYLSKIAQQELLFFKGEELLMLVSDDKSSQEIPLSELVEKLKAVRGGRKPEDKK